MIGFRFPVEIGTSLFADFLTSSGTTIDGFFRREKAAEA
jgi:hypothetical protein